VVRGFTQQQGVDYEETFNPVIKSATIWVVLSLAIPKDWPIHQLDVKNALLHGNLSETVYAHQPGGFVSPSHSSFICKLNKSLYGLKQAPRIWFLRFTLFLSRLGFQGSKSNTSLFVFRQGSCSAYVLLYVDDIILTISSTTVLNHLITQLQSEFAMSDLGTLQQFLGVSVHHTNAGLFISQDQYATDILTRANMLQCNSCLTPTDTKMKPSASGGTPLANPTKYHSLARALQYLTLHD
jgi:hypothetical protein